MIELKIEFHCNTIQHISEVDESRDAPLSAYWLNRTLINVLYNDVPFFVASDEVKEHCVRNVECRDDACVHSNCECFDNKSIDFDDVYYVRIEGVAYVHFV